MTKRAREASAAIGHAVARVRKLPKRVMRPILAGVSALALFLTTIVLGATTSVATPVLVSGQVAGNIEIDGPAASVGANLYPGDDAKTCSTSATFPNDGAGTAIDWVKNCSANSTSPTNTGNWHGFRTVDGIPDDQDIFLQGGKENDTSTWNVGPGSVGSAKYDYTQAYLANNQQFLYFGAHRAGNDGTTAFDLEANAVAPAANSPFPDYIPTRTVGDVLFTFEMQGSGNESGSVAISYFRWGGTTYVKQEGAALTAVLNAGLLATMNGDTDPTRKVATAAAPPWGTYNARGNLVTDNLQLREFMEARVPLSVLNVSACGGTAYMQIRTRASAEEGSDLKDASKIFQYNFTQPTVSIAKSVTAANRSADPQAVTVTATPSGFPANATLTYLWEAREKKTSPPAWSQFSTAASPVTYSTFGSTTTGDPNPVDVDFALSSDDITLADSPLGGEAIASVYKGRVWVVEIRLTVSGGTGCSATSSAIVVKKINAVDP